MERLNAQKSHAFPQLWIWCALPQYAKWIENSSNLQWFLSLRAPRYNRVGESTEVRDEIVFHIEAILGDRFLTISWLFAYRKKWHLSLLFPYVFYLFRNEKGYLLWESDTKIYVLGGLTSYVNYMYMINNTSSQYARFICSAVLIWFILNTLILYGGDKYTKGIYGVMSITAHPSQLAMTHLPNNISYYR